MSLSLRAQGPSYLSRVEDSVEPNRKRRDCVSVVRLTSGWESPTRVPWRVVRSSRGPPLSLAVLRKWV